MRTGLCPSWAVAACAFCASAAVAQAPVFEFAGTTAGANLGFSVAAAGDVNADGVPDLITGAYRASTNGPMAGEVTVRSGVDGTALYRFHGRHAGDELGRSVSGAGDVNGDGYADILMGAANDDSNGPNSGAAYVHSGRDGSLLHAFHGSEGGESFGISVSGGGDANGDGYDDVLCGARLADGPRGIDSGSVSLFSGRDGRLLRKIWGADQGDQFGHAVAFCGDVDADGADDFIVGAYMADQSWLMAGAATVYSGATGHRIYHWLGDSPRDWFGISVAGAGDIDGDGFADVIVGALWTDHGGTNSGSANVYSGINGALVHQFNGDSSHDMFGCAVAHVGDLDGDGFDDVGVGACGDDDRGSEAGSMRIFSGLTGATITTLYGGANTEMFGSSVAVVGDFDDDGVSEIAVGARGADLPLTDAGRVEVFSLARPQASRGVEMTFGVACVGGNRRIPRMAVAGSADIARTLVVKLHGARQQSIAALHVGHGTRVDLGPLGLSQCTAYVDPVAAFRIPTNSLGSIRSAMFVPNDPQLAGLELAFQWAVVDPLAPNALGVALSDALYVRIGL